jgi:hypothetical protein
MSRAKRGQRRKRVAAKGTRRTIVVARRVAPERDVVLLPLEADLQVVVLLDEREEVFEQVVRLVLAQLDDAVGANRVYVSFGRTSGGSGAAESIKRKDNAPLRENGVDKQALPPGDRVDRNDRVHSLKVCSVVRRVSTHAIVQQLVAAEARGAVRLARATGWGPCTARRPCGSDCHRAQQSNLRGTWRGPA